MTLRGMFWKPGINGLGVGSKWLRALLPYKERFDSAAREHDAAYDCKGDGESRFLADKRLLREMLCASDNDRECFFAIFYYTLVRMFGWLFYRYDKPLKF